MAGELATGGISAAVSGVVATAVTIVINWGRQLLATLKTKLAPDHSALWSGVTGALAAGSPTYVDAVVIRVAYAPIRRRQAAELDPDSAIAFATKAFPGIVAGEPEYSSVHGGVRFIQHCANACGQEEMDRELGISPNGRVDLWWRLPIERDPNSDRYLVPLEDVAGPLIVMLDSVGQGYRGLDGFSRLFRRRFDWFFGVSIDLRDKAGTNRSWDVAFPGRPAKRAGSHPSFCPAQGFAARELRSWRSPGKKEKFLQVALTSFLKHNGYYNCDRAISDALAMIQDGTLSRDIDFELHGSSVESHLVADKVR